MPKDPKKHPPTNLPRLDRVAQFEQCPTTPLECFEDLIQIIAVVTELRRQKPQETTLFVNAQIDPLAGFTEAHDVEGVFGAVRLHTGQTVIQGIVCHLHLYHNNGHVPKCHNVLPLGESRGTCCSVGLSNQVVWIHGFVELKGRGAQPSETRNEPWCGWEYKLSKSDSRRLSP